MKIKDKAGERFERFVTEVVNPGCKNHGKIVRASNSRPRRDSKYYGAGCLTWDQENNCEVRQ